MKEYKHIVAASSAYFIWGFFSFGLKPISNFSPFTIMCYRIFLCIIILSIISLLFRKRKLIQDFKIFKNLNKQEKNTSIISIFGGAVILLLNWLGFIYVINEINVQTAGLTYLICPILTAILSFIILKEKLSINKWIAITLSSIACILLSVGHFKELIYAILVALAFAIYLLFQKKLHIYDSLSLLNIQTVIIAILLIPAFLYIKAPIPNDATFYYFIGIIVILFTIIPMFLNNFALKKLPASTAGILIYLNPIVNFILAIFYFKENITIIQYIAYSIIVFAIIIYNAKFLSKKYNNYT